jgi:hypothetical protein
VSRLRILIAGVAVACAATSAHAGFLFTPRVGEYGRVARAPYDEAQLYVSEIEKSFDRDGDKVTVGTPFVEPGESVRLALLSYKALWAGNLFRDTGVWGLRDHDQFCRLIVSAGWQQATGGAVRRSRVFGFHSGGSGPGDVFADCGIYGNDHSFGPLKVNGLVAVGLKAPVGRYDEDALLNTGTNYWTWFPQLAGHAELYGRLIADGIVALQVNGRDRDPAYGGLVPDEPADVFNAEGSLAWKFDEHWYANLGFSYLATTSDNRYGEVEVESREPLRADTLCDALNLGDTLCNSTNLFFAKAVPGEYRDDGVRLSVLTAGFSYVYRSSSVVSLRALVPLSGRGSQIDVPFDLYPAVPDLTQPGRLRPAPVPVARSTSTLNGVQEAASAPASVGIELRIVYLFWAP